jgi:hypothetical protein
MQESFKDQFLGNWDGLDNAVFTAEEVHMLLREEKVNDQEARILLRLAYDNKGMIRRKPENTLLDETERSSIDRLKDLTFVYNQRSKKRDDLGVGIENPKFNYYRASGDCICPTCGEKYYDHPVIRGKERRAIGIELYVLCNTDRVKT